MVKLFIERMIDKMFNVSCLVDKLLVKGLVECCIFKEDCCWVDVSIIEEGFNILV